jgi:hypothetical protein
MSIQIVIVSKRQKKAQGQLVAQGYTLVDVTSNSESPTFQKFSPFYPHGGIPVPGQHGKTSESVEGVWQGLKVFENQGVDTKKFAVNSMKNLKRVKTEKTGRVVGHDMGGELLDYVTARKNIYIPTYSYVLEHHLKNEVALLKGMLEEGAKLAILDYDVNENVEDTSKPLSHASLIKNHLKSNGDKE